MDVEQIARSLTKAQREQVARDAIGGDFVLGTVKALTRKGLFAFSPESPNGRCGPVRITPLGLAVRAYLENSDGR